MAGSVLASCAGDRNIEIGWCGLGLRRQQEMAWLAAQKAWPSTIALGFSGVDERFHFLSECRLGKQEALEQVASGVH